MHAGLAPLLSVAATLGCAVWWQLEGRRLAGRRGVASKVGSTLQAWQRGVEQQLRRVPLLSQLLGPRRRGQRARQSWQAQEPTAQAGRAAARRLAKVCARQLEHPYVSHEDTALSARI